MRVLYLDIDGCLNTVNRLKKAYGEGGYQDYNLKVTGQEKKPMSLDNHTLDHITNINWQLCYALETLIKVYQIDGIVVCSTWRKLYDENQLKLLFIAKGFPFIADLIIGLTPINSNLFPDKENEISEDMKNRGVDDYYILDDDVWDYASSGFEARRLVLPTLNAIVDRLEETLGDFNKMIKNIPMSKMDLLNVKLGKYKYETIQSFRSEG